MKEEKLMPQNLLLAIHNLRTGGAEILVKNIAKGLDKKKFNVSVFLCEREGPGVKDLEDCGTPVFALRQYHGRFDVTIIYHAYRVIKDNHIDIVHTHLFVCNLYVRFAAYLAGCRRIIVHEHGGELRRPVLVRCLFCLLQFVTDCFLYISNHDREHFSRLDFLQGSRRLLVLGNPSVLVPSVDPRRLRGAESVKVIGMVGQLSELKGHRFALEAFAKLRDKGLVFDYFLLGDGALRTTISDFVKKHRLNVVMPGIVDNVAMYYQQFDLLVHPSLSEGFGMVIVEAMSFGIPVIATRVGGIPEIISHGVNGWLVDPASTDDIVRAIQTLTDDLSLFRKMAMNAYKKAEEKYTFSRYLTDLETIYE